MLERAGAWLLAIHGRTREQKRASEVLVDWEHVRAVKQVRAGWWFTYQGWHNARVSGVL